MRLVLPEPVGGRLEPLEVTPGVRVQIHVDEPLPLDAAIWRRRVSGGAGIVQEQHETQSGWPVTLILTADARLCAFFSLHDRGTVVVATARDVPTLRSAMPSLRTLLLAGDIDRRSHDVVALDQLFEADDHG